MKRFLPIDATILPFSLDVIWYQEFVYQQGVTLEERGEWQSLRLFDLVAADSFEVLVDPRRTPWSAEGISSLIRRVDASICLMILSLLFCIPFDSTERRRILQQIPL
jgi:hypothetical protein